MIAVTHPVIIVEYDPDWPDIFEEEKKNIIQAIGEKVLSIDHIGSTAVPGLGAKNIVDMMVGLDGAESADEILPSLEEIGYDDVTPEPGIDDWHYCLGKKRVNGYFHLHLVTHSSEHQRRHIQFRDCLRENPAAASEYYQLKVEMAGKFTIDREKYTESKTRFIEKNLAKHKN